MKKKLFILMLFALTATVFTGCKKDKNDDAASIEGIWKSTKDIAYYTVNGVQEGDSQIEEYDANNYEIFTFNGGNYTFIRYVDGQQENEAIKGRYTYSNNQLIADGKDVVKVKLDGKTLIIIDEDVYEDDGIKTVYITETHYVRQ